MAAPFSIIGLRAQSSPLLGIWESAPLSSLSFSRPDNSEKKGEDNQEVIWSVTLPENPTLAEEIIQSQCNTLKAVSRSISKSGHALQKLPSHWLETGSFTLNQEEQEITSPETALQSSLTQIMSSKPAGLDFSSNRFDTWQHTIARYRDFTRQTLQLLKPTLRVETRVEENLTAFTQVQLDGDLRTVWLRRCPLTHSRLHHQNLSFTLESRLALFKFLTHVMTGAAVISSRFAFPGGVLMALPVVWQYISDVIDKSGTGSV